MAAARLQLPRFKGTASIPLRLFSTSAALIECPWTRFTEVSDSSDGESTVYKEALKLQRPSTIRYDERLVNSVSLIGRIFRPLQKCKSKSFGVYTTLSVSASTGNFSVSLNFRDEMAEMTLQHLKLNDFVYVSGCLGSYMKADENGKSMNRYQVVVREVNFVSQDGLGPAYKNLIKLGPSVPYEEILQKRRDRLHLWQIFFASPFEWWDNRNSKLNPKCPDFKHKDTGEVLWLTDNDPPWVRKQLKLHDSRSYRQSREHRNARAHLSPLVYE
ncbi:Protein OSB1- mitochondrial [Striga hermonthica]|uniref:Protein OSB1- mitochondrial n=1 Tax=Striga hermonthica TaxID=68872 RepID=A0A9N7MP28_STRHE|nr:Protein OSB1- mitochondrial [Striga hermonthica]